MSTTRDAVPADSEASLLLVAGTGRSGTSTVAGSLSRLGYVVPQPEVPADETNPRGFFEPRWVVDFHKRILDEARVRTNDLRPKAVRSAAEVCARPELTVELTEWLRSQRSNGRLVVKDPRSFWAHDLWRSAARANSLPMSFLTMLRPPVEVARSRDQHYLAGKDAELRRARQTTSVGGWCNGILVTELVTRGDRRAFVRYHDLMGDWRDALRRADEQLGTGFMGAVGDAHHPVDDFIDATLNRSGGGWEGLGIHPDLTAIADEVWAEVCRLVDDPSDAGAMAALDDLSSRYDALYAFAADLTLEELKVQEETHRRALRRAQGRNQRLAEELEAARRSLPNRLAGRANRAIARVRGR